MKTDSRHTPMNPVMYVAATIIVAIMYIIQAEASLQFTKITNNTSAFWIPTGFAIALLIRFGLRFSFSLIIAKLILGIVNNRSIEMNILSMLASLSEAWIGYYLFYSFKESIEKHFEYHANLVLISMVAVLAPVTSAMIGVTSLLYHSKIAENAYFSNWITWYTGDVLAAFIFLPAFLYKLLEKNDEQNEVVKSSKFNWIDFFSPIGAAIFTYSFHFQALNSFIFAIFIMVLIPNLIGTNRGMFYSLITVSLMLNWMQVHHTGPFSVGNYQENLASMQFFLLALAVTALGIEGFKRTGLIKNAIFPLMTCWFLSGVVYFYYHSQKDITDEKNLNVTIVEFGHHLTEKVLFLKNSINGIVGFVASSQTVSKNEWIDYINSISLLNYEAGIKSVALIYPDAAAKKDIFFYNPSKKNYLFLTSRKSTEHPILADAMTKARQKNEIIMTAPIAKTIADNPMKLSFFVMPVFKHDKFIAWVISSFELEKIIAAMAETEFQNIDIDVYAGKSTTVNDLIYRKIIDSRFRKAKVDPEKISTISLIGQRLTVYWNETSRFISVHNTQNSLFVLIGAIFSLVVTGFIINLGLLNVRANQMARRKTLELSESEEKFKSLFNHSSDAVILFNNVGIIDCNPQSLNIFGKMTKKDLLATPLSSLFNVDDFLQKLVDVKKEKVIIFEGQCNRNGTLFFAETHLHYLDVLDNFIYQAVVRDISERKKTEQNLIASKEMAEETARAKAQFLSTMSHEIRTPLNGVIGMIDIILEENPQTAIREDLETIKYSADNLLHVVNEVLDFNKIEAGKMTLEKKPFSLQRLCINLIKIHSPNAQIKNLDLKLIYDDSIPAVIFGDEYRNSQILHNLISNALKFTMTGSVLLEVSLATIKNSDCMVQFRITDTGIGINDSKRHDIFKVFTQAESDHARKFGGSGLGLAICKRLIEIQDGFLELQSIEGAGTSISYKITFKLPPGIPYFPAPPITDDEYSTSLRFTGQRVLLVEDNAINVLVTKKFLEKWGLTIDVAINGQDAVNKVQQNNYVLILMDLHMPIMDGIEATKQIRAMNISTPIIGLSADVMTDISSKLTFIGMNDFVTKPFKPNDFLQKIKTLI